jgi:4-amino-4-deoxy-L-arabinose transferase-like glycosyltransferase
LLFLAIAAPWHVLAARDNADFLYFYFVHEHYLRFTTTIHGRYAPWWYFGPVIVGGFMPWMLFSVQALRRNFSGGPTRRDRWEVGFLVIWIAVITLFFSKSQSKLAPYILPVFPPLAVLVGRYLAEAVEHAREHRGFRIGLWVSAALLGALLGAVVLAKVPEYHAYLRPKLMPWRFALGGVAGAGAASIAWFLLRGAHRKALVALVASFSAFLLGTNFVLGLVDSRSSKLLAMKLLQDIKTTDAVYCVGEYVQDFPVYLNRQVDVVRYQGELAFGIQSEPSKTASRFIDTAAFGERWKSGATAYALLFRENRQEFFDDPQLPCFVVAETPRYLLVTNKGH